MEVSFESCAHVVLICAREKIDSDTLWALSQYCFVHLDSLFSLLYTFLIVIGVILLIVCLERFYSSCRRVYARRDGRDGFSQLQASNMSNPDGSIEQNQGGLQLATMEIDEHAHDAEDRL